MVALSELLLILAASFLRFLLGLVEARASKCSSQEHYYTWKHTSRIDRTIVVDWRWEMWLVLVCLTVILLFLLLAS
jgi:hypothetical protein